MEINYNNIYLFGISLSAIVLILTLTNMVPTLNFGVTVFATILIIISGLITWISDIYYNHKIEEEKAAQYWEVWNHHPFKRINDKKRVNLIVFIFIMSSTIILSRLFILLREV